MYVFVILWGLWQWCQDVHSYSLHWIARKQGLHWSSVLLWRFSWATDIAMLAPSLNLCFTQENLERTLCNNLAAPWCPPNWRTVKVWKNFRSHFSWDYQLQMLVRSHPTHIFPLTVEDLSFQSHLLHLCVNFVGCGFYPTGIWGA